MKINLGSLLVLLFGSLLQTNIAVAQVMSVADHPGGLNLLHKNAQLPPPYVKMQEWQHLLPTHNPVGVWKCLIILIDFPDYTWDMQADSNFVNPVNELDFAGLYSQDYFLSMLFSVARFRDPFGRSEFSGSMRDFYRENSYGLFDIDGIVTRWYRADSSYRYYCNTDGIAGTEDDYGFGFDEHSAYTLVNEAISKADAEVDFSQFDNDLDRIVDALFIVHAGPGAEEIYTTNYPVHFNYFWSHQSAVNNQIRDNVIVSTYTLEPENGSIGVFCHEFGHALGLPDLYDVDRSSEGIGEWCLMGSGGWCYTTGDRLGSCPSHFSAWSKYQLGWLQPVAIQHDTVNFRLPPVEQSPVAILLSSPQMAKDVNHPEEYFLLENRQNILFDAGLTRRQVTLAKPLAAGLLIYHVNERISGNSNETNKRVDVEEASPFFLDGDWYENLDHERDLQTYQYLDHGNRGDNGDPFPGYFDFSPDLTEYSGERAKDEFSDQTHPNSRAVDGTPTLIAIKNIRIDGQDILLDIRFNEPTQVPDHEAVTRRPAQLELAVYPNPVSDQANIQINWQALSGEQSGKIIIFNLLGEQVREITFSSNGGAQQTIFWDTLDDQGHRLQNGIYFVICQGQSSRVVNKILLAH